MLDLCLVSLMKHNEQKMVAMVESRKNIIEILDHIITHSLCQSCALL